MMAMMIGYARTSTIEQTAGYEAQLRDLQAAGAERIFQEQISAVAKRDELARIIHESHRRGRWRVGFAGFHGACLV